MADTNFVTDVTVIEADWLNDVNLAVYNDVVNVKLDPFNATGDGVTDDTAAIQAALNTITNGGVLYLPQGNYVVSASLVPASDEVFALRVIGDGILKTVITATHTTGYVLGINRSGSEVSNLTITSAAARKAAASADGYGLRIESLVDNAISQLKVSNVRVLDQPSHGIVASGYHQVNLYQQVICEGNLGHGLLLDDGTVTGISHTQHPWLTTYINLWCINNGGHGVCAGNPADTVGEGIVRNTFINCEFDANATDAAIRHSAHDSWIRGVNTNFDTCALSGETVRGGLHFEGNQLTISNTRFVECTESIEVSPDAVAGVSTGVYAKEISVYNTAQNPAISVTDVANVEAITLETSRRGNIISGITPGVPRSNVEINGPTRNILQKRSNQQVINSTTLVDEDEMQQTLGASEYVNFVYHVRYTGDNETMDLKIGVTGPAGATVRWYPSASFSTSDTTTAASSEDTESTTESFGTSASGRWITIQGYVQNSTTQGNLKLQFAQNTADAGTLTIAAGSWLEVFREI